MDRRQLNRLCRILGLLGSDQPGERDAAALAADRLVTSWGTTWNDLLLPAVDGKVRHRPQAFSVDEKAAAEARMRQLRDNNERLEKQVQALRRRLAHTQLAERRRRDAAEEDIGEAGAAG